MHVPDRSCNAQIKDAIARYVCHASLAPMQQLSLERDAAADTPQIREDSKEATDVTAGPEEACT